MCDLCFWGKASHVLSLAQFPHQCSWVGSCRWQSDLVSLKHSFQGSLNSCRARILMGRISGVSPGAQGKVNTNLETQTPFFCHWNLSFNPSTGKVTSPWPVSEHLGEKWLFPLETIWKLVSSEFSLVLFGACPNSKADSFQNMTLLSARFSLWLIRLSRFVMSLGCSLKQTNQTPKQTKPS